MLVIAADDDGTMDSNDALSDDADDHDDDHDRDDHDNEGESLMLLRCRLFVLLGQGAQGELRSCELVPTGDVGERPSYVMLVAETGNGGEALATPLSLFLLPRSRTHQHTPVLDVGGIG